MLTKVKDFCRKNDVHSRILYNQFGYTDGLSIYSAQQNLYNQIKTHVPVGGDATLVFFVDIKDAYGSVILPKLLEIVENNGIWKKEEI